MNARVIKQTRTNYFVIQTDYWFRFVSLKSFSFVSAWIKNVSHKFVMNKRARYLQISLGDFIKNAFSAHSHVINVYFNKLCHKCFVYKYIHACSGIYVFLEFRSRLIFTHPFVYIILSILWNYFDICHDLLQFCTTVSWLIWNILNHKNVSKKCDEKFY